MASYLAASCLVEPSYLAASFLVSPYLATSFQVGPYLAASCQARPYLAASFLASPYLATSFLASPYLATSFLDEPYLATSFQAGACLFMSEVLVQELPYIRAPYDFHLVEQASSLAIRPPSQLRHDLLFISLPFDSLDLNLNLYYKLFNTNLYFYNR